MLRKCFPTILGNNFNTAVALGQLRLKSFAIEKLGNINLKFVTMISQLKSKMMLSMEICEDYFCTDYRLLSYWPEVGLKMGSEDAIANSFRHSPTTSFSECLCNFIS